MPVDDENPEHLAVDSLDALTAGELIDDRALARVEDDAFGLRDFVEELAARCRVIATPSNIALYGAWGSGKTSLGNLLGEKFKDDKHVAFGRFDAFKFAEVPLRRHFLASVAASFKIRDEKYSRDLYRTKKDQNFRIRPKKAAEVAGLIAVAALALTALMAIAAAAVALIAIRTAPFGSTFVDVLTTSAAGIVIAAPIVAALLAAALRRFEVETTTSAPFSDEEFERLFVDLVASIKKKHKRERAVIFIDELDRCSPKQVGSVLETLRTFLDVESCVFVVAADQQVLEHALMEGGARQATPHDRTNPYYSSGSAYLDKIFHHQVPLPPLLSRRLSRFAFELIDKRPGVWQRVPNRAELVSVLVPTHVRSPRRVKTLLNTFSSLYRLAILRAAEDRLDTEVEARASEIAKLVCLRTEFPLFSRDLVLDARLPELVLQLHDEPEARFEDVTLTGLSRETFDRAKAYALEQLPVDDVLAETGTLVQKDDDAAVTTVRVSESPDEDSDAEETHGVQRAHARQLLRYLERTKQIPGPRRDLIYLESSGVAFGLPAEFADRLEEEALDGRAAEVSAEIEKLDEEGQHAAYRLLAQLVVEGSLGLEASNAATCLFAALAVARGEIGPVADEVLTALVTYGRGYALKSDDIPGALRLALASDSPAATEMRAIVLRREEVLSDRDLGLTILEKAPALAQADSKRVSEVLAARLADTQAGDIVQALSDSHDDLVVGLVREIEDAAEEDKEGVFSPANVREFAEAALGVKRHSVALAAFDRLLALDSREARTEAEEIIGEFAPITDPVRVSSVLGTALKRAVSAWPRWLEPVAPAAVEALDDSDALIEAFIKPLWDRRFKPASTQTTPVTRDQFLNAGTAVARLKSGQVLRKPTEADDLLAALPPSPVTSQADTDTRTEHHEGLLDLVSCGLLPPDFAAGLVLGDLGQTLAASVPATTPNPVATWVQEESTKILSSASREDVEAFVETLERSPWLDAQAQQVMQLLVAAALRNKDASVAAPVSPTEIEALISSSADGSEEAVACWVEAFLPGVPDVLAALRSAVDNGLIGPRLRSALGTLGEAWEANQKADLVEELAPAYRNGTTRDDLLRELRVGGAEPERVADILVAQFEAATNNDERERMLRLWGLTQPSSQRAQRVLIDKVFLPLVTGGKGQTKLALDHFGLVATIAGKTAQGRIKKAFDVAVAEERDLQKRVNRVLKSAGWIKKPRRFGIF